MLTSEAHRANHLSLVWTLCSEEAISLMREKNQPPSAYAQIWLSRPTEGCKWLYTYYTSCWPTARTIHQSVTIINHFANLQSGQLSPLHSHSPFPPCSGLAEATWQSWKIHHFYRLSWRSCSGNHRKRRVSAITGDPTTATPCNIMSFPAIRQSSWYRYWLLKGKSGYPLVI